MKIKSSYIVFPMRTPNSTYAKKAMYCGYGMRHYCNEYVVELPDELVSNPQKWFDIYGKSSFSEIVKSFKCALAYQANYNKALEHPDETITVDKFEGKRVICISSGSTACYFYLDEKLV